MPNNYNGNSVAADFTAAVPIILDGEVWQYGDADSGVFGMIKPILDRLARLKAFSGFIGEDNAWTGTNTWGGSGKSFIFQDTLDHAGVFCDFRIENGGVIRVKNLGSLILEAGSLFSDAADRTITGSTTYSGPGAWREHRHQLVGDADATIHPENGDMYRIQAVTGNRTYTIADPPGKVTFKLYWYNYGSDPQGDGSYVLGGTAQVGSGSHIIHITGTGINFPWVANAGSDGTSFHSAEIYWNGTAWEVVAMNFGNIT